jgi:membrane protease YdiL (CAAX protease family)
VEPFKTWVVFVTYGLAVVAVLLMSVLAGMVVYELDPAVTPDDLGVRGLIAGALASAVAFALVTFAATRGMPASRIRFLPGRERGRDLLVMIAGVLSLGQALDSLVMLSGHGQRGAIDVIRRALAGATGVDLFAAVVVIGVVAAVAEEAFFRGYMQSLLRERWRPGPAVTVTSLCFAVLHLDPVHALTAFVLGLYLGLVTELAGSVLPAAVCHVVNNSVATLLIALVGPVTGVVANVGLLVVSATVFTAAMVWLWRSLPRMFAG